MNKITSKGFFKLADLLETIRVQADADPELVNMDEVVVFDSDLHGDDYKKPRHLCKTPHCFAGWTAIAAYKEILAKPEVFGLPKNDAESCCFIGFSEGIKYIIKEIFKLDMGDYKTEKNYFFRWIRDNPLIWGTPRGYSLFKHEEAFGFKEDTPNKMYWIIRRLRIVGERLLEQEQKNKELENELL